MREIKFRLWCKDLEEIIEVNEVGFENNKLWYIECIDHDKELLYFPEKNDHVLMEYTGLKDKNGKKIYEGDIVKHLGRIGEITWECEYKALGFYLKSGEDLLDVVNPYSSWALVIIGNIYENPELLEESK
ncbi:YopX family protein [Cytobacillus purgationiresistens]|uniref:Phage protein (TIGR01671 family) n=1 Tax=Cytobacillus purgationiresistens TaxID=863449 RepID=A0ABU0ADU2_9BACI|nr:YopX family protein [Cytobacillus purgationiresistens]MDQ0268911.1 putative phage protein (TIGR01671 family) [Cytobacillus purgationiresistens]